MKIQCHFHRRRGCMLLILILSLLLIFVQLFAINKSPAKSNVVIHNSTYYIAKYDANRIEVRRILMNTPNLWGFRGSENVKNETIATRVKHQRKWVERLASTEFIKNVKPKKILVYLVPHEEYVYFGTDNKLKCPYAPDFENKCQLVLLEKDWKDVINNHPPDSYYRDLQVEAVIGMRNGYGVVDPNMEPTLPSGIHQIYYVSESPCHSQSALLGKDQAWLSTYWKGSDIPVSFRNYVQVSRNKSDINDYSHQRFMKKDNRKLVVALMSNCRFIENDRMGYIAQLRKYIPVDMFGSCGNLTCPTSGDCLAHLGSLYKFYLAFENCNCEDYVTEKFSMNALEHNMVPVVMGASPIDYADLAPPHSFIHVNDFFTPKDLANYLKLLDGDEVLYGRYGEWRNSPGANWQLTNDLSADFFCRTCGLLYAEFKPPPPYPSRSTTWNDLNKCLKANEWKWPTN